MARKIRINSFDILRGGKVVDTAIQSIFILADFYAADDRHSLLLLLVRLQMVSFIIQLFVRFRKKLKVERWICAVLLVGWQVAQFMVVIKHRVHVPENMMIIFNYLGAGISFWYIVISFREIKYLLGKKNKRD